jgi:hypothetical protein
MAADHSTCLLLAGKVWRVDMSNGKKLRTCSDVTSQLNPINMPRIDLSRNSPQGTCLQSRVAQSMSKGMWA